MIFEQWQQVLDGTITTVSVPVRPGEQLGQQKVAGNALVPCIRKNNRVKWYVGQSVAVQPGARLEAVGRVRIIDIGERVDGLKMWVLTFRKEVSDGNWPILHRL